MLHLRVLKMHLVHTTTTVLQAAELLETHGKLVAGPAGTGNDVKVALGGSVRKLKQHWKLGEMTTCGGPIRQWLAVSRDVRECTVYYCTWPHATTAQPQ